MKSITVCKRACDNHPLDKLPAVFKFKPFGEYYEYPGMNRQTCYRWNPEVGIERKEKWMRIEPDKNGSERWVGGWRQLNCCRECPFHLEHIMATQKVHNEV